MSSTQPDSLDDVSSSLTLSVDPKSVREARLFVRRTCELHGVSERVCEGAVLLTSEIVTNALTHGHSEARLNVTFGPSAVRIEVSDENSYHPERVLADADAIHGRGLAILERIASAWGVRDEDQGKTVWFDIDTRTT